MAFLIVSFAIKNAMFNLNESNRIVMSQLPTDMWMVAADPGARTPL